MISTPEMRRFNALVERFDELTDYVYDRVDATAIFAMGAARWGAPWAHDFIIACHHCGMLARLSRRQLRDDQLPV